jgi:hypothetical protein
MQFITRVIVFLFGLFIIVLATGGGIFLRGVYIGGFIPISLGVILMLAAVFEDWRYKNPQQPKDSNLSLVKTNEAFLDPISNQMIDVYFDPTTGNRVYCERQDN